MTALLYISYSSDLNQEQRMIMDKDVLENREKFFIIINNTHSTIKIKVKKGILVITFLSAVYFSGLKPVEAIGLSLPPNAIVKVNPSLEDYSRKPTIVKIVPSKFDPFFF